PRGGVGAPCDFEQRRGRGGLGGYPWARRRPRPFTDRLRWAQSALRSRPGQARPPAGTGATAPAQSHERGAPAPSRGRLSEERIASEPAPPPLLVAPAL